MIKPVVCLLALGMTYTAGAAWWDGGAVPAAVTVGGESMELVALSSENGGGRGTFVSPSSGAYLEIAFDGAAYNYYVFSPSVQTAGGVVGGMGENWSPGDWTLQPTFGDPVELDLFGSGDGSGLGGGGGGQVAQDSVAAISGLSESVCQVLAMLGGAVAAVLVGLLALWGVRFAWSQIRMAAVGQSANQVWEAHCQGGPQSSAEALNYMMPDVFQVSCNAGTDFRMYEKQADGTWNTWVGEKSTLTCPDQIENVSAEDALGALAEHEDYERHRAEAAAEWAAADRADREEFDREAKRIESATVSFQEEQERLFDEEHYG